MGQTLGPTMGMDTGLCVAQALAQARQLGLERLDAQLLLGHHLGQSRGWLIAHDDACLPVAEAQAFAADCQRRADDFPMAYLLGRREFHRLTLHITPDVLVPRPDTETLVGWGLERLNAGPDASAQVLDLGTGSGAIALALAHSRPEDHVTATDLSAAALRVAKGNAQRLGLRLEFRAGDWWQAVQGARFDLVLSNPPYIADNDPHLRALRHEPRLALCSGIDGMSAIRSIVAGAPRHLHHGAWLLLEHGWDQAAAVRAILAATGFAGIATRPDIEGRPRCTGGHWIGQIR